MYHLMDYTHRGMLCKHITSVDQLSLNKLPCNESKVSQKGFCVSLFVTIFYLSRFFSFSLTMLVLLGNMLPCYTLKGKNLLKQYKAVHAMFLKQIWALNLASSHKASAVFPPKSQIQQKEHRKKNVMSHAAGYKGELCDRGTSLHSLFIPFPTFSVCLSVIITYRRGNTPSFSSSALSFFFSLSNFWPRRISSLSWKVKTWPQQF